MECGVEDYHDEVWFTWLMAPEDMEFTRSCQASVHLALTALYQAHLPHNAEYFTLMMMSVGSMSLGIGRSSIFTSRVPLKTTAFIVFFDMMILIAGLVLKLELKK